MKHTVQNVIYKAKRGHVYDSESNRFNCYMPVHTGKYQVVDCWVCDQSGNIHPGYNCSPVPVFSGNLGVAINRI